MTAASHLWPARFGHQQVPSLFCMVTTDKCINFVPYPRFSEITMGGGKRNTRRRTARPALNGHRERPDLATFQKKVKCVFKAGYMAPGITFSTTHRDFTKTRVWYKMNTVFVVSISNNPYMRNLREFCLIPCQP
ncbi:hypothetical protein Y032_0453g1724 [Ancylostoma ceylanicum]|uniref:Uncharacterized protein n=1 Tax=Ancylostoma ceylanicum TaxID=53326 RepID=A0A016WZM1_9BILA|nr:hypothetical protein Y032_0453g1724 [Ancylostoma ceylanicum]